MYRHLEEKVFIMKKMLISLFCVFIASIFLEARNIVHYSSPVRYGGLMRREARATWDKDGKCVECEGRGYLRNSDRSAIAVTTRCPICQGDQKQKHLVKGLFGYTLGRQYPVKDSDELIFSPESEAYMLKVPLKKRFLFLSKCDISLLLSVKTKRIVGIGAIYQSTPDKMASDYASLEKAFSSVHFLKNHTRENLCFINLDTMIRISRTDSTDTINLFVMSISQVENAEKEALPMLEDLTEKQREKNKVLLQTTDFDFRKSRWGASMSDVMVTEKNKPLQTSNDMLTYQDRVAGVAVKVLYIFANDQLVRAKYIIDESFVNDNKYIYQYNTFVTSLTKKYSSPNEEKTVWSQSLYKSNVEHWGMAISCGHMYMYTKWETQTTAILCILDGEGFESSLTIEYASTKLGKLEDAKIEQETFDLL